MQLFDAEATRRALPYPALIEALRRRFAQGCEVPPRHVHNLPSGTVLIMPAWSAASGRLGIKTVNVFPGNGARGLSALHATYTLFDANTGVPLALIDGSELTTRRTVAASALAASYLARDDAATLLVVGAGRLAAEVPAAMHAVRPGLRRLRVWNHRAEGAQRLARQWADQGWPAEPVTDLAPAVREADIVSCVTLSTTPLVRGDDLQPGAHLDLVGAFTPQMRECDGACLRRAAGVWVDTAEALAKAGDLLQAAAEGAFDPARTRGTLADLCQGGSRRPDATAITVFKSVGTALEDLAAAELVLDGPRP